MTTSWNPEAADRFVLARSLINTVIAAYTGRITAATDSDNEEAARLREERLPYLSELQALRPDDDRIAVIVADYAAVAARIRAGGQ